MRRAEWWDKWFLGLAEYISTASKDPSTKVGAVIIKGKNQPISWGYNGFAKGIDDSFERLNDRDKKYPRIVHAERNSIIFAQRDLTGCTIFTFPFMPCSICCSMIIQAGITRCVAPLNNNPRWQEEFKLTRELFQEAGVELKVYAGG